MLSKCKLCGNYEITTLNVIDIRKYLNLAEMWTNNMERTNLPSALKNIAAIYENIPDLDLLPSYLYDILRNGSIDEAVKMLISTQKQYDLNLCAKNCEKEKCSDFFINLSLCIISFLLLSEILKFIY